MQFSNQLKRIFSGGQSKEEVHSRYCAIQNTRTVLVVIAFCALEVFLSWKGLGKNFPSYNLIVPLRDIAVLVACVRLIVIFTCVRERLVISVIMVRSLVGLVSGLFRI